jgi:hypothetical protein
MSAEKLSGYTDAAERTHWKTKCENEARANYDTARARLATIADELASVEEDFILDGLADIEDANYVLEYFGKKIQELSVGYVEAHRWKILLKDELGVDP